MTTTTNNKKEGNNMSKKTTTAQDNLSNTWGWKRNKVRGEVQPGWSKMMVGVTFKLIPDSDGEIWRLYINGVQLTLIESVAELDALNQARLHLIKWADGMYAAVREI